MILTLPWPARDLSPNGRNRWRKIAAVKAARTMAYLMTRAADPLAPAALPLRLSVTFHPPDRRRRDLDNMGAMTKAYQDGLCQAIGVNDEQISELIYRRGLQEPGGRVELELSLL